jgi:outer membrane protein, heavy metal efflux system
LGTTVFARGALPLVAGFLCLLVCAPVWAQTLALELPQVVDFSRQHNAELSAFRAEKGLRDAGTTRAGLLPNPVLELEGGSGALTGSSAESNLSIGVLQEFLLSGKRAKRLAVAGQELEMYRWQLADRERLLREAVSSAFYDVIVAEKRLALSDGYITLNRELLDLTRERLDAGDIPELEMNLVKVELARSEGARISADELLQQTRARLLALMGRPGEAAPALSGALEAGTTPTQSLAELQRLARGNRPDLKALEAEKGKGDAEIALARAEGIPNLSAGLALRRDTTGIEVGGVEGRDRAYTIGLKLSLPIPVFDRNQAAVQEAAARRNSTGSRLSAASSAVEREVETAYRSLKHAEKVLALYRAGITPQLEENLKLTLEAYRLGEVGMTAVIQEQKKFFEVNEAFLTALHDRQAALVKLEAAAAAELTGGVQ